jgi:hypothetical protein
LRQVLEPHVADRRQGRAFPKSADCTRRATGAVGRTGTCGQRRRARRGPEPCLGAEAVPRGASVPGALTRRGDMAMSRPVSGGAIARRAGPDAVLPIREQRPRIVRTTQCPCTCPAPRQPPQARSAATALAVHHAPRAARRRCAAHHARPGPHQSPRAIARAVRRQPGNPGAASVGPDEVPARNQHGRADRPAPARRTERASLRSKPQARRWSGVKTRSGPRATACAVRPISWHLSRFGAAGRPSLTGPASRHETARHVWKRGLLG